MGGACVMGEMSPANTIAEVGHVHEECEIDSAAMSTKLGQGAVG